jgi:hypothetical protein
MNKFTTSTSQALLIKKLYQAPLIEKVALDHEISLVMTSNNLMPTEPGDQPGMSGLVKINRILRA